MRRALIEIRNLSKTFGRAVAVDNVSLDIFDREFLVLLGPSGCGKTTLLRLIGGFETPTAGQMHMRGRDLNQLPPNKRPVNMVFQSYAVFPHMNVRDNIAYGLRVDGVAKPEINKRVDDALALVQLESLGDRYAHQLSGGQRQRVALARALIKRPRVLLLDEPLSALDAKLRETMQNELVKLQHTVGVTFVVVTHDQDEALSMAERVAVMDNGRVCQLDTPRNLYEAPQNRFVADFVGRMNILPAAPGDQPGWYAVDGIGQMKIDEAKINAGKINAAQLNASAGIAARGQNKTIAFAAIRPEKLAIVESAPSERGVASVAGAIEHIAYYGGETVLTVKTAAYENKTALLTVAIPNSRRNAATPDIGARVIVAWRAEDVIGLSE